MNKKNKKDQNNSYVLKLQSENSERQSERVGYKHILK